MAGIFGSVSKKGDCAKSLYYGVDYHCHLGTDYAGLAVFGEKGIERKIHDIRGENFRPKFQQDYAKMKGQIRDRRHRLRHSADRALLPSRRVFARHERQHRKPRRDRFGTAEPGIEFR